MMTLFGKLFVLVNLAASLVLGTMAFSIYSNGIDWSDNKGTAGGPPGRLAVKKADVTELSKQLAFTADGWAAARNEVWTREDARRAYRGYYAGELEKLYTSKNAVDQLSPDGQLDQRGVPQLVPAFEVPDVRLQSLSYYLEKSRELTAENARLRKELEAKVKEDTELTNRLTGDPERKTKGLRMLIADERVKRQGITDEIGIVEGLRVNRLVESELILKRLSSINERVQELTAYLKQRHKVDAAK